MPYLRCSSCNHDMEVNTGAFAGYNRPNPHSNPIKLMGSATCRNCGAGTGFELNDNVVVYVSGKSGYGKINAGLSDKAKALYAEAELSFQNGTPNASVAMCRASLELALNDKGFTGNTLFEQIGKAKSSLSEVEIGLAHSSRLIARDAIHRGNLVGLSDIPSMLSATVRILNKLVS